MYQFRIHIRIRIRSICTRMFSGLLGIRIQIRTKMSRIPNTASESHRAQYKVLWYRYLWRPKMVKPDYYKYLCQSLWRSLTGGLQPP